MSKALVGAKHTDRFWDKSVADVENIMRREFPPYNSRVRKCLAQMSKNSVKTNDTHRITNYAIRYRLNVDKILAMYK